MFNGTWYNKYHSRKRKKVSPRVLRPILREEKTW